MRGGSAQGIREELLRSLAADRIHGAYLLEGPAGTGKRETAAWLARRLLLGEDAPEPPDLRSFPSHADLRVVEPDGAFIKVDQVRALQRDLSLVANERGRRVAVILDAHRLREEAANALLKTLEEPPRGATLLLVSDAAHALPATVLSRTTRLRFVPEPEAVVAEALAAEGIEPDDAWLAAALGGGSRQAARAWVEESLEEASEMRRVLDRLDRLTPGDVLDFAATFRGGGDRLRARTELFFAVHGAVARRAIEAALRGGDAPAVEPWLRQAGAAERAHREWRRRNLNAQLLVEGLLLELRQALS